MRARRREAGFTLIELMIVIVLIAVLAVVAVPAFMSESNRTKATSEVNAMFAQFAIREEQYKVDNNVYLAVAQCPAALAVDGASQDVTGACTTTVWQAGVTPLRVAPPSAFLYCRYQAFIGTAAGAAIPAVGAYTFAFNQPSPAGNWYYLTAECDLDGDGVLSAYATASFDTRIQVQGEGE